MSTNRLINVFAFLCFIGGFATTCNIADTLPNYLQALRFLIIFVPIGFLIGLWVRRKLQKRIERTVPLELQKAYSHFIIVMAFVSFTVYFGTILNRGLSTSITTRERIHEMRHSLRSGYRAAPSYSVVLTVNGKPTLVRCSYDYWKTLSKNDSISVVFHDSRIGFDYIELPEDH